MSPDPKFSKAVCLENRALLQEYVSQLDLHNKNVRDYAAHVNAGLDGDCLGMIRKRVEESQQQFRDARQRYADHRRDHDC